MFVNSDFSDLLRIINDNRVKPSKLKSCADQAQYWNATQSRKAA